MKAISILLLLVCLLAGCRTIHKLTASADSTVYRTADTGEQWQREIIREYLPGPVRYDTVHHYDTVPHVIRVPTPYPVREIIRESGARKESSTESKQVQTETREKDATTPIMIQAMMLLCGLSVFGAIFMALLTILRK
jgi:hypothetical protein